MATSFLAAIFVSGIAGAASEIVDQLEVTVEPTCQVSRTSGSSTYAVNMSNNTTRSDIGSSTLNIVCNDGEGWRLMAQGWNAETEEASTDLTHSTNSTFTIPTGLDTSSSTSSWAMKINTAATGIQFDTDSGFTNNTFHAVPSEETRIVYEENNTTGTELTTSYQVHISASQPAGTYKGGVKYTLSHPATPPPSLSTISNMQEMTPEICAASALNETNQLKDTRDGTLYKVAKLADNKCWMQENLALEGGTTITSADSNIAADSYTLPTSTSISTSPAWANSYDVAYLNSYYKNGQQTASGYSPAGKVGVYYNYCAATAGTYCYASGSGTGNAQYDICPKGWRMPTGGSSGEYQALYTAYSSNAKDYQSALSTPLSGYFYDGLAYDRGSYGYFWSSTRSYGGNMYNLGVDSSSVDPAGYYSRYRGYSMRCVVSSVQ